MDANTDSDTDNRARAAGHCNDEAAALRAASSEAKRAGDEYAAAYGDEYAKSLWDAAQNFADNASALNSTAYKLKRSG